MDQIQFSIKHVRTENYRIYYRVFADGVELPSMVCIFTSHKSKDSDEELKTLQRKPQKAKRFYGVLTAATLIGLSLNLVKIDPIRALFGSAIINGVVAVPVMIVVMLLTANRKVMGEFSIPILLKIIGWIATAAMFLATVAMFVTLRH